MKFYCLFLSCLFFFNVQCGVKGKPLPPETPREIGIGKPQYKGVDKALKELDEKKLKEKAKK